MESIMKGFFKQILITTLLVFLLASCGGGGSGKSSANSANISGCKSSSDMELLQCIQRSDFVSATGEATSQSQKIARCTILGSDDYLCELNELNFLAAESTTPTKEQIMSRLIVSDSWMAENFSTYLDAIAAHDSKLRDDLFDLFTSVTAIVIHDEIRHAFFWSETGAIYLDPRYLWLTQEQKNSIPAKQDYRSDFGNLLNFSDISQYTKDGQYAFGSATNRTEVEAMYLLSALLFHELAHARDAFSVSNILLGKSDDVPRFVESDYGNASEALFISYPLQNSIMLDLGEVLYQGVDATHSLISLTAGEVGLAFESDGANDSYNYSYTALDNNGTVRAMPEDTAMLFEETMMNLHFGINRELAFVTELVDNPQFCQDFVFAWTTINRFADNNVIHRAKLVVDALLPNHTHSDYAPDAHGYQPFSQCSNAARGVSRNNTIPPALFWH